jgi:hypothetical protein
MIDSSQPYLDTFKMGINGSSAWVPIKNTMEPMGIKKLQILMVDG